MHPTFAIVSPSGDRLELATDARSSSPYALDDETTGLGLADREVQITPSTTDGGRFRASRATPRSALLVIDVWGRTAEEHRTNLRRLTAAIRRVNGKPLPRLTATYPDGTAYELPFVYDGGAEALKRRPAGGVQVVPLSIVAPDPFWTARIAIPYGLAGLNSTGPWLPHMAEMRLSSSAAQGALSIDNPGEIDSYPTWRLTGPATLATVSLGGTSWSIGPIELGEVVTIDTRARTAVLDNGTNVYRRFRAAPRLFPIPPGASTLSVVMTDAAPSTSATCFFKPRMEVIL